MFISEHHEKDDEDRRYGPRNNTDVSWAWIPSGILELLEHLRDTEDATLSELDRSCPHSTETVRKRIDWLERRQLVTVDTDLRSAGGRGAYQINITAKGAIVYDIMDSLADALDRDPRELLDTFSDVASNRQGNQVPGFRTGWDLFVDALDRAEEASP